MIATQIQLFFRSLFQKPDPNGVIFIQSLMDKYPDDYCWRLELRDGVPEVLYCYTMKEGYKAVIDVHSPLSKTYGSTGTNVVDYETKLRVMDKVNSLLKANEQSKFLKGED